MPPGEIFWGGVPRDGIPAINEPKFVAPMDAKFPMVGLLETIYDDVSKAARELRRDS